MTQHLFRATFANDEIREQIYSRDLTHAWRVSYTRNGAQATKYGFSGSREKAEKAVKLPKACTDITVEIVHAMKLDAPTKATSAKPKKAKLFHKGDKVIVILDEREITGSIDRIGSKYAYVSIAGALASVKVATQNLYKHPLPLAQAA
jgi:hypothetical protein